MHIYKKSHKTTKLGYLRGFILTNITGKDWMAAPFAPYTPRRLLAPVAANRTPQKSHATRVVGAFAATGKNEWPRCDRAFLFGPLGGCGVGAIEA
jgi:hypothetical protein